MLSKPGLCRLVDKLNTAARHQQRTTEVNGKARDGVAKLKAIGRFVTNQSSSFEARISAGKV